MATCVVGRGPWRWPVGACVFSPKASPSTHALAARRRNTVLCPGPLPWPTHRPAAGSGGVRHLVVLGWGPRTWLYLRSLWCPGETGPEVSAWELKPMLCVSRGISGGFLSLILGLAALPFLAWPKLPSPTCIPTPVWALHGKHASPLNLGIVG